MGLLLGKRAEQIQKLLHILTINCQHQLRFTAHQRAEWLLALALVPAFYSFHIEDRRNQTLFLTHFKENFWIVLRLLPSLGKGESAGKSVHVPKKISEAQAMVETTALC